MKRKEIRCVCGADYEEHKRRPADKFYNGGGCERTGCNEFKDREQEGGRPLSPATKPSAVQQLSDLLRDNNIPVQVGLRAQGHIPTVERMLAEGKSWDEIGAAINWDGATAAEWYAYERGEAKPEAPAAQAESRLCNRCYQHHPGVSCYWHAQGKTSADKQSGGRTFVNSAGRLGCAECCNGDRCDDPTHHDRENCPYCLGSGIPLERTSHLSPAQPTLTDLQKEALKWREREGYGEVSVPGRCGKFDNYILDYVLASFAAHILEGKR